MTLRTLDSLPQFPADYSIYDSPYPILKAMRAQAPLAKGIFNMTFALHQRHIDLVTSDATRQLETEAVMLQGITSGPIFEFVQTAMLFANGESHTKRRSPISRTFAFKLMDAMRPRVVEIATEIIEANLGRGPISFVDKVAAQIPARIIAEVVGVPQSDLPIFMQWIQDTADAIGYVEPERRAQIESSLIAFNAYVQALLDDRRATPRQDFLTDYISATTDSGLTEQEIRTQVLGVILAGSDTTRGSLCMTLAQLLAHPDQWRDFCADPQGLKTKVVQEGLRYEPIVSGVPRVAVRDLEIDGYAVPAGSLISVSLLSVLRDPKVYADPEAFNIHRTDHPRWHPIFGGGAHRCAGEALAKAEMEETLATIAKLAPNTELIGDFPRLAAGGIRQIDRMEVALA